MRFIHFEGQESVNLEKVIHIAHDILEIQFTFSDSKDTTIVYWLFDTEEEAEKVYREILSCFSYEIKIED